MFYSLNENVTESIEDIMKNDEIVASPYEDFMEGAMAAVVESQEEFSNLMEYIGVNEASQFAETGEPVVYTEASFGDIKAKIRAFINKVIEKIKSIFKRVVLFFDKYIKNNKDFLSKYEKRIRASSGKDLEFKGYPFPANLESMIISDMEFDVESDGKKASEDDTVEDIVDMMVDAKFKCNRSELKSTLFEKYHGSDSKETLDNININTQLNIIKSADKDIKMLDKAKNEIIKSLNKEMKEAEKKDISGYDDAKKAKYNKMLQVFRQIPGIYITVYGEMITAAKDRASQARAICAKAMVKSGTLTRESATIEHPAYEGFFDGFDMI